MRTYSGHSTPEASNALYRRTSPRGRPGSQRRLRPADADRLRPRPSARRGRGREGRRPGRAPRRHARALRRDPDREDEHVDDNQRDGAVAPRALRRARRGARTSTVKLLSGTTQNDILKEYLSRGTFIFPPATRSASPAIVIAYAVDAIPEWNPINICSYHLQEAGATPVQELAYALTTAICVLDTVKDRLGAQAAEVMPRVGGADLVLRQRGGPVHRGDVQAPRVRRALGPAPRRALRRHRREARAASATACRSTRSGSPRRSRRTTSSGSCSRCSRWSCRRTRAPAPCSSRRGTKRSACRVRGTSSGASARSRSSPSRPTCSTTRTSSTAAPSSRRR